MKYFTLAFSLLLLAACAETALQPDVSPSAQSDFKHNAADSARLAAVLATQTDESKARYQYRNPQKTLEFFGIKPGMTVLESLPGAGWYSKILLPYLGDDGKLIGVSYDHSMWPLFGFFSDEQIEERRRFVSDWPKLAGTWRDEQNADVSAHIFGSIPSSLNNKVDAVLFIRALHNLSRFEDQGQYLTTALADAVRVLKPGGIVGVVQHEAPVSAPDASTRGDRGYLKKDQVIAFMEAAGLRYVGETPINQNTKDVPAVSDIVWRLPPTRFGTADDPVALAKVNAIGESNRMTLKFVKP